MKIYNILILEDDIETLSILLKGIHQLNEEIFPKRIGITVFSEYLSVEKYINNLSPDSYDIILLDRDCNLGGSFHALNIEKFGIEKVISISSTPKWNEEAKERGVSRIVLKVFDNLEPFSQKVVEHIKEIISNNL